MKDQGLPKPRIPTATYRLQFNGRFRFSDAAELLPYLHTLGISDIYASPCLRARRGSPHGYDIIDHATINPEAGGAEEFDGLADELRSHGMGLLLDIVPNHMCVEESGNAWWTDVLENGPSSPYAGFFDIDWSPVKQAMRNRVLLPILGDQYGAVLENGELRLAVDDGAFIVGYYEHRFPVMPESYGRVLSLRRDELERELGNDNPHFQELLSIMTALEHLPPYTEREPDRVAERYREKEVIKRRLAKLCGESDTIDAFVAENVRLFNGETGVPASFDLLDRLLREQVYRLSYWRVATEEINYRRFFDINALGAIRVEREDVFNAVHGLVFGLIREGKVTGLRVDHADGLYTPTAYLHRLQAGCFASACLGLRPDRRTDDRRIRRLESCLARRFERIRADHPDYLPFYVVSEKILMRGEWLPADWPVFGDTGYSFGDAVGGIFVATENARAFDKIYRRFTRTALNLPEVVYEKKKLVMQSAMSSEINTLGHYLDIIAGVNRHTLDFTFPSLVKALVEVIAFFPVYRTYTSDFQVSERDRRYIEYAVGRARRRNPAMSPPVFDFIRDVLLLDLRAGVEGDERCRWLDFVMRFQQITSPVTAKGMEDTAWYLYNRLVSLNEVGGAPERFGLSLADFHEQNRERRASRPHALLATSTHDTKRSEDVRARISGLSEMPLAWREALGHWSKLNRRHKRLVEGQLAPDHNEEYLLYQTLIGAWPLAGVEDPEFARFRQRIGEYMIKALREAKVNTSWVAPNAAWEEAVIAFVNATLKKGKVNKFLGALEQFQTMTSACGMFTSLSQTLLKIASPGVPDFYQGNELWDFSLVDPDNRRLVDFQLRRDALAQLMEQEGSVRRDLLAQELLETRRDGRIKLYLIRTALGFRNRERELFDAGEYLPMAAEGEKADNVCAFARTLNGRAAIVVAPRFFSRLVKEPDAVPCGSAVWGTTSLPLPFDPPNTVYRNVLTGETLTASLMDGQTVLLLAGIARYFPVALLERLHDRK